MARKRKLEEIRTTELAPLPPIPEELQTPESKGDTQAPPPPVEGPQPQAQPGGDRAGVLNIPINSEGGVAWDTMRPATKERVLLFLQKSRPEGFSGPTGGKLVTPAEATALAPLIWGLMGAAQIALYTIGVNDDVVKQRIAEACQYSPMELDALSAPTGAMIAKYFPDGGDKWMVEITFAMAVFQVHAPKVQAAFAARKAGSQ